MANFGVLLQWREVFAYLGVGLWIMTVLLEVISAFLRHSGGFLFPRLHENEIEQQIKRFGNTRNLLRVAVIYVTIRMAFALTFFNELNQELLMVLLVILPCLFIIQLLMKLSRLQLDKIGKIL
jgi:hypothetical protein